MNAYFAPHDRKTAIATALACYLFALCSLCCGDEPKALPISHDEYLYMIRFSPDGNRLVTAAGDNVARVWDWSTRQLIQEFKHDAAVYAAVFSPKNDNLIATGSGDGEVSLWNSITGKQVANRQEHADAVYCLNFSADGKNLASIGGDGKKGDTQCRIWSVPSLEVTRILPGHDRPAYGALFGPGTSTDSLIVTSGGDKLIHAYKADSDKPLTLKGHTSDVYRCCFSPDGKQLASTSQDRTLRLWSIETGQLLKVLYTAKDPTYDVTYSEDGKILAAVGDDGFVRFRNTKTHKLLWESKADKEGLYSVVFTPDQTSVLVGGVGGKVYQCPVPTLDSK